MKLLNLFLTDAAEALTAAAENAATGGFGAEMSSTLSFAERIQLGLQVTGLGLGVVFVVLAILWGVLTVFRIVFYDIPKKNKAGESAAPAAPAAPAVPAAPVDPLPAAPAAPAPSDDAELVAAITAAIAVMMDKPQTSFRVVSFRRTASK